MNKGFLILVLMLFFGVNAIRAQVDHPESKHDRSRDSLSEAHNDLPKIVVNMDMINRFNSVQAPEGVYSWSQLLISNDGRMIRDFFHAYRTCDLDDQTMQDIKLALESNQKEYEKSDDTLDAAYFAAIKQMKKEINQKLDLINMQLVNK